jgi:hypothetical protein
MLKLDEHGGLHGSGHQSIIPCVHGRCCIAMCVVLLKAEFKLSHPVAHPAFYSSRPWQLHCDAGPDRWL